MTQLAIWSAAHGEWQTCRPDEITWLDRELLSAGKDTALHRSPRCPGLRYVHYRWELFSRDTTHRVYLAPYTSELAAQHQSVQMAATHVLPMAPDRYETVPVRLTAGAWLVSVGNWVLPISVDVPSEGRGQPTVPLSASQARTQEGIRRGGSSAPGPASPPLPDAVSKVRAFFDRNGTACLAIAYLYQEYILGAVAPQAIPMTDVAIALDLSGEGTISDYKKELQRRIWNEQRHQRELPEFLLANALISAADLQRAKELAVINERSGRTETARKRLRYRPKK
jgi:hypothetical protein